MCKFREDLWRSPAEERDETEEFSSIVEGQSILGASRKNLPGFLQQRRMGFSIVDNGKINR